MDYINKIKQKEIYTSEKKTQKDIFRYEYYKTEGGWWLTREHYNVESTFPERSEMWIPDEIIDHITASNAKEKLS